MGTTGPRTNTKVANKKNAANKNNKKTTQQDPVKRIVVIDPDKVKPNSEAFRYFARLAGGCGRECIQITATEQVIVAEDACPVCVNRCKQCPTQDAVSVVKLPTNLTTNAIHQYGPNAFTLHGLPIPRPGHVLGLLGQNGAGKSTALKILSGRTKPNMGQLLLDDAPPDWASIVAQFRGSDLQNYFSNLLENKLTTVLKPQLESGFVRRLRGQTVRALLEERDERGMMERYTQDLDLVHVLDRHVEDLSGGELQRFAVAATLCKDADVYMFDEVTSFLDMKQRLQVTKLIRSLVHEQESLVEEWPATTTAIRKKYVIVVEHDLTVLDYMSDFVQCLYGSPGAYGVVTARSRVKNGINHFLAGYIPVDNMRFRDHPLTFKVTSNSADDIAEEEENGSGVAQKTLGMLTYPNMSHTRTSKNDEGEITSLFTLHVESGSFRDAECVALMGENGTGKSTFMEMLAGLTEEQRGEEATIGSYNAMHHDTDGVAPSLGSLGVSYKKQGMDPKLRRFKGTVRDLLEHKINAALADSYFRLLVMKPFKMDAIMDLSVARLSGGEMQKVSIAICLGTSAMVYLIDEPSAALDCEQRIIAAKVMKRWVVHHLGRTLFLVEHDFVMTAAMADRVIVYEGTPGVECTAGSPVTVAVGFNRFLQALNITFRRDPANFRPRINKSGSRIDKQQKAAGEYYVLDSEEKNED